MFAFSRHNYYVQKKLRPTRTPEEQHASSDRGNTDVCQYFYDQLQQVVMASPDDGEHVGVSLPDIYRPVKIDKTEN